MIGRVSSCARVWLEFDARASITTTRAQLMITNITVSGNISAIYGPITIIQAPTERCCRHEFSYGMLEASCARVILEFDAQASITTTRA